MFFEAAFMARKGRDGKDAASDVSHKKGAQVSSSENNAITWSEARRINPTNGRPMVTTMHGLKRRLVSAFNEWYFGFDPVREVARTDLRV